jgi:type IV pilus assembly protein PilM
MFGRRKRLLGIDIGSHAIKAVLLKHYGKGGGVSYELEKIALEPVAPQVIVEGDIIDSVAVIDVLDRLLRDLKVRTNDVAISLAGNSVIIKKITVPQMNEGELQDSIQWEAEQYIPFEIDEVMVDFHQLGPAHEEGSMDVVLVAVKKEKVNDYTSVISQVGKNTSLVDVDVFSIQNCFEVNYPDVKEESTGLVNIGASVTSINIIERGKTAFWRDIMTGGNRHTEALQRSLGLGIEQAEDAKRGFEVEGTSPDAVVPVLDKASGDVVEMIAKTFDFYLGSSEIGSLNRVLVSGGAASTPGLVDLLGARLNTAIEVMDPFRNINVNTKRFDVEYIRDQAVNFAVAVGLAVRVEED